jgi:hypothetical protein
LGRPVGCGGALAEALTERRVEHEQGVGPSTR